MIAAQDPVLPKENKAWVMKAVGKLTKEKRPLPQEPEPYDVVIAPRSTALCTSDVHLFCDGRAGEDNFSKPTILGHEPAGIVTKVGSNVKHLAVGDRVAIEPSITCRRCEFCKSGSYGQCGDVKFAAADGFDGTLQSFVTFPADFCYKLAPNVSLEEGALLEPLAVAVMAVWSVAKMPHNANVAVFGVGPVGLLVMAVCKALGARRVLAIDVQENRLNFAKNYVGCETHKAIPKTPEEDSISYAKRHSKHIMSTFGFGERGEGIDLVIEASGAEVCVQTGICLVKRRGKFVQVGAGPANNLIPMSVLVNKEVNLIGSLRHGPGCYDLAVDLVAQGRINLKPLLTHRFSFEEAELAFEAIQKGVGPDGKMVIKVIIDGPLA